MNRSGRLTLAATLEQTSEALELLMSQLAAFCPPRDLEAIELGAAEVMSNIVRHGYAGEPGVIRVTWTAAPRRIEIRFCDRGRAIPDKSLEDAASTVFDFERTDVAQLPEGGFGLALVRRVFHRVQYRSRCGVNRLVAVRRWRERTGA